MLGLSRRLSSRYIPVVGRAFLVEALYGSKYSPHMGSYQMPYLYVKTLLLCAAGKGLTQVEAQYVRGLVEALLPSNMSEDNLTKLELMQFVDAVPSLPVEGAGAVVRAEAADAGAGDEDGEDEGDVMGSGEVRDRRVAAALDAGSSSLAAHVRSGAGGAAELMAAVTFISAATFPARIARILIYDAASTCLADGVYSAAERERVALVAAQVGLSSALREEMERLAMQERILQARKRRLLNLSSPQEASRGSAAAAPSSLPLPSHAEEASSGGASHSPSLASSVASVGVPSSARRAPRTLSSTAPSVAHFAPVDPAHGEYEDVMTYVRGRPLSSSDDEDDDGGRARDADRSAARRYAASAGTGSSGSPVAPTAAEEAQRRARELLRAVRAQTRGTLARPEH